MLPVSSQLVLEAIRSMKCGPNFKGIQEEVEEEQELSIIELQPSKVLQQAVSGPGHDDSESVNANPPTILHGGVVVVLEEGARSKAEKHISSAQQLCGSVVEHSGLQSLVFCSKRLLS